MLLAAMLRLYLEVPGALTEILFNHMLFFCFNTLNVYVICINTKINSCPVFL